MKTSTIYLSFLFCLGSVVLTSEEEERTLDLSSLLSLLGLGTAAAAGAATATAAGSLLSGLNGGKGGKAGEGLLSGLFSGDGGKGKGKGKDGKGKGKGGKGKRRSLIEAEQERQDLSTLFNLVSLLGGNGGPGLGSLAGLPGGNGGADLSGIAGLLGANSGASSGVFEDLLGGNSASGKGKDGKGGKDPELFSNLFGKGGKGGKEGKGGKGLFSNLFGRSSKLVESTRHGKGKEGKGKGKDNTGSSLLDSLSNFGILGQIIQAALSLLTGVASSLNPFRSIEPKAGVSPLPNPLADPLGFLQNPLISAFLEAIISGDGSALMKALGDLAGTLITQFITNTIAG